MDAPAQGRHRSGNGDLHAKNISLLHRGEWTVSPAYDLPSSLPYGDHRSALSIGGKSGEDLRRKEVLALGANAGVPAKATNRVLDRLLRALPSWLERIGGLPFDARTRSKLQRSIELRATRLS